MNRDVSIDTLIRWRLTRAEDDAPPPPRASELLDAARPWWERWPEQFRTNVTRLQRMPAALAYAQSNDRRSRAGASVPALIVAAHELETYARVLYVVVRDERLRLRFRLESDTDLARDIFEATFIDEAAESPMFSCPAQRSQSGDYRVDVVLPPGLTASWARLTVADRMPFRLILREMPGNPSEPPPGARG